MSRTDRYQSLLPVDRLQSTPCTVIGVGAIGRQVAIQIAAMGVGKIHLVDFDTIDEVNLGPQAYFADDVGRLKVHATADIVHSLNPMADVTAVSERFAKSMAVHTVIFCCVDSIQTRRHIFNAVQNAECFIDGRMAAEVLRVLSVTDAAARKRYSATLFDPSEAHREGCTAKSTIYCANVAAGLMVAQFSKWLRGIEPDFEIAFNVFSAELSAS